MRWRCNGTCADIPWHNTTCHVSSLPSSDVPTVTDTSHLPCLHACAKPQKCQGVPYGMPTSRIALPRSSVRLPRDPKHPVCCLRTTYAYVIFTIACSTTSRRRCTARRTATSALGPKLANRQPMQGQDSLTRQLDGARDMYKKFDNHTPHRGQRTSFSFRRRRSSCLAANCYTRTGYGADSYL